MKNILMILAVVAISFTACDDQTKNLSEKFEDLQKESDSINQAHSALMAQHEQFKADHAAISQQLMGRELEDSTWLEDLARHEVVLKNHEAQMAKHDELIRGHQELRNTFSSLTAEQMEEQISMMRDNHDAIMNDHETMRDDHEQIRDELESIREDVNEADAEAEADKTDG